MMEDHRKLLVLYGSQTGTAQAVAERIGREAKRLHFQVFLNNFQKILHFDQFEYFLIRIEGYS